MKATKCIFIFVFTLILHSQAYADLDDLEDIPKSSTTEPSEKKPTPPSNKIDLGSPELPEAKPSTSPLIEAAPQTTKPQEKVKRRTSEGTSKRASEEILWSSDRVSINSKSGVTELIGSVKIKQGGLRMRSKQAFIYLNNKKEVSRVEAIGQVRIIKEPDLSSDTTMSATAEKGNYYSRSQTVVLTGKPKLHHNNDKTVTGKTITYNLDTGWITAKRVEGMVKSSEEDDSTKRGSAE